MLINVEDPRANVILNACFLALAGLTALSVVPWSLFGVGARFARWLPVPALVLYAVYEGAMPARMDIRVDLLLLGPMGGIILTAWGFRVIFGPPPKESGGSPQRRR